MKTLQQIEPRMEVNAANTPGDASSSFVIAGPGSYYLSSNLVGESGKTGIRIVTDDVTLDLNGFVMYGVTGSGNGIGVGPGATQKNIVVRNGTIRGWAADGIRANAITNAQFENLRLSENTGNGLYIAGGSSVRGCTAEGNGDAGFRAQAFISPSITGVTIQDCVAAKNQTQGINLSSTAADGSTVVNCTSSNNVADGIRTGKATVVNSTAIGNGGDGIITGIDSTVVNCGSMNNAGDGIEVNTASTIQHCNASDNDGDGIRASTGTVITSCVIRRNQGDGILVVDASQISDCSISISGKKTTTNTAADGIEMGARNRVFNCTIYDNAQHGINSTNTNNRNFIEHCMLTANDSFGIALQGNGNTVINNQVGGNAGGSINQTGGNIAPIENASDPVGTIHPLANFQ
jgi:hypothetical protein